MAQYDYTQGSIDLTWPPDNKKTYYAIMVGPGSCSPATNKLASLVDGSITNVTAEDLEGIVQIKNYAFYNCKNLANIVLPIGVTNIGSSAFWGCTSLTNIIIPDSVQGINNGCFYNCTGIMSLIIGTNLKTIGNEVFFSVGQKTSEGCAFIIYALVPPTLSSTAFNNTKINKIIVPAGTGDIYKTATNWSAVADYIEEAT